MLGFRNIQEKLEQFFFLKNQLGKNIFCFSLAINFIDIVYTIVEADALKYYIIFIKFRPFCVFVFTHNIFSHTENC